MRHLGNLVGGGGRLVVAVEAAILAIVTKESTMVDFLYSWGSPNSMNRVLELSGSGWSKRLSKSYLGVDSSLSPVVLLLS